MNANVASITISEKTILADERAFIVSWPVENGLLGLVAGTVLKSMPSGTLTHIEKFDAAVDDPVAVLLEDLPDSPPPPPPGTAIDDTGIRPVARVAVFGMVKKSMLRHGQSGLIVSHDIIEKMRKNGLYVAASA